MAMSMGRGRGGMTADINMTPMIDVLLVLLIIFMVVQAGLQRGLTAVVPPPEKDAAVPTPPESLVLEMHADGGYALNRQPIAAERLTETLRGVFAARPRKVLFIKAAETLTYGDVIQAMDASRAAGVEVVGLVPRA